MTFQLEDVDQAVTVSLLQQTATNALLREKGLQLTSKSYAIFWKGRRRGWHIKFQDVSIKSFEQAKDTKDIWVTAIKNVIPARLGNAETAYT